MRRLPIAILAGAWLSVAVAGAQQAPDASGLESIAITARKIESDLQSTAEAVTAFPGEALERWSIDEVKNLGRLVPNVRFENSPGTGPTAAVTIRGISQPDPLITGDPSVGIYVDGIYHPRMVGANFGLFDVERIEVLRGPQGTLYGKNTPAGAVNVWSRRADGSLGGYLRGTLGSYRRRDLEGALAAPLREDGRLSGRIAFLSRDDDGYVRNHSAAGLTSGVGGGIGDQNGQGARGSLLWRPGDALEVHLQGFRYRERRHAGFPNQVSLADPAQIVPSVIDGAGFDTAAWVAFAAAADEDDAFLSFRGRQDLEMRGGSAQLRWELGDLELHYLAGLRSYQFLNAMDLDGSPASLFDIGRPHNPQDEKSRAFSQELSGTGTALGERLRYTGGLYLFDERSSSNANQYFDSAFGGLGFRAFGDVVSRIRSWALYAQGSWALTERLDLTLGLRHTEERREMTRQVESCVGNFPCEVGVPLFRGSPDLLQRPDWSDRWDALTWLAGLELRASDELFLYAKVSSGYRSGGWNGRGTAVNELEVPFDEELVTAYELGAKRDWLDSRLRANLALFHQKYKDLQTTALRFTGGAFATLIVNSGNADISGGELELWAQPLAPLRLSGALGWHWFRFSRGSDHATNSPALSYALRGEYAFPPLALGELSAGLELQYQSRNFASEGLVLSPFGVVNGRIGLRLARSGAEIALLATNLLDRRYAVAGVDFLGAGFGYQTRYYAARRRLALELTYRFGSEAR